MFRALLHIVDIDPGVVSLDVGLLEEVFISGKCAVYVFVIVFVRKIDVPLNLFERQVECGAQVTADPFEILFR